VVPYNQPVAALDMLSRFLKNETFLDYPSPTIRFGDTSVAPAYAMANPTAASEKGTGIMKSSTVASMALSDEGGTAWMGHVGLQGSWNETESGRIPPNP
jgi:hypothetical protein